MLLVQYRVDGYRRLAGHPVADDKLPLPLAYGYRRIDDPYPGDQHPVDRLSVEDRGRVPEYIGKSVLPDMPFAVEVVA